jgi:hypothetical protein
MNQLITDPQQVSDWMEKNTVNNSFRVGPDGHINVNGSCTLIAGPYKQLPVRFSLVTAGFACNARGLTTLEGCPETVGLTFMSRSNPITNLVGGPTHVGASYNVLHCPLESLEGLPREVGRNLLLPWRPHLGYLRAIMVEKLERIVIQDLNHEAQTQLEDILNRYRSRGVNGVMPCAAELIKAGYRENARL